MNLKMWIILNEVIKEYTIAVFSIINVRQFKLLEITGQSFNTFEG